MPSFVYSPVPHIPGVIRLLDIDLSGRNQHKVIPYAHVHETKYHALSYRWGEADRHHVIHLDGKSFGVSPNLKSALDAIVSFWTRRPVPESLLLWVDQVCIDQQNDEEKSRQVKMMGQLYSCAQHVFVWLSVPIGTSMRCNGWPAWLMWLESRIIGIPDRQSQMSAVTEAMEYAVDASSDPARYPVVTRKDAQCRERMLAWHHMLSIVEDSYWGRVWVYQEFILSKQASFLIDGLAVPWEVLNNLRTLFFEQQVRHSSFCAETLRLLKSQSEGHAIRLPSFCEPCLQECQTCTGECNASASNKWSVPPDCFSLFAACWRSCEWTFRHCYTGDAHSDDVIQQQQEILRRHSTRLLDSLSAWSRINGMMSNKEERERALRSQSPSQISVPLSRLMQHSRNCQFTKRVDKVYAFLGLARSDHGIQVDYHEPEYDNQRPERVAFTDAARSIIEEDQNLDVLAVACENQSSVGLPSWVADWSADGTEATENRDFLRHAGLHGTNKVSLDQGLAVCWYGEYQEILQTTAIRADVLGRLIHPAGDGRVAMTFRGRMTNQYIRVTANARTGDEVWVLFGAKELFLLRRQGHDPAAHTFQLLGQAEINEDDSMWAEDTRKPPGRRVQFIRDGALVERWRLGQVEACDILIV